MDEDFDLETGSRGEAPTYQQSMEPSPSAWVCLSICTWHVVCL